LEEITLYDLIGKKIQSWKSQEVSPEGESKYKLRKSLTEGIYIVTLKTNYGKFTSKVYMKLE
jgi:hypothetical protein